LLLSAAFYITLLMRRLLVVASHTGGSIMGKNNDKIRTAKRNTLFAIIVTFFVGIVFTLLTAVPGPWDDWVEEKKEKRSGKE